MSGVLPLLCRSPITVPAHGSTTLRCPAFHHPFFRTVLFHPLPHPFPQQGGPVAGSWGKFL